MPAHTAQLVGHLQRLAAAAGPASDADLLERYIRRRDQDAFAGLVGRYGPMVLLVCRRMLADTGAAEDCLQATFLVLARKAASIRRRESLAAFLHGVACRVARKARAAGFRRGPVEALDRDDAPADPRPDPLSELTARELMTALDEEVGRLPEAYRLPVVLCCLEGLSLEEAARRLGWSPGSVKGRLERGRKRLHDRLARRGLTLGAVLAAVEVSRGVAAPVVAVAAGCGAGSVSARVAALAEGIAPAGGALTRLTIAAVLLSVGVAAGMGLLLQRPAAPPGPAEKPPSGQGQPARQDQAEPLPPGALARMGSIRFCPGSNIHSVAFTPDGRTVASGSMDGTVSLWEVATGKEIALIQGSRDPMHSIAFSPDGKLLACRGENSGIALCETPTGKPVRRFGVAAARFPPSLEGSYSWGFRIVFSPDGKTLAAASGDLTGEDSDIRLWDVATGKELRRFQGHKGAVRTFAFAPDGKTLASSGVDGTLRLWDPDTAKQLHLARGSGRPVLSLSWSPGGKTLASGGDEGAIRLWGPTGKETGKLAVSGTARSVLFIDDGMLAWGDEKGTIHLTDLKKGKEVRRLGGEAYGISELCRCPDGKTLASVREGPDHVVHLWQLDTGKRLSPALDVHQGGVESVAFSPDGKTLFSASSDRTVRSWDPATGKERQRLEGAFFRVAASPDGRILAATADGGRSLRFLDAASGKELRQIKYSEGSGWFTSVAFSPDGKTLLAGGNRFEGDWKGVGFLWDVSTGKPIRQFRGHSATIKSVAFSPDGKTAATGGEDNAVYLWETASGKEVRRLQGHQYMVETVAFAPGGEVLASADTRSILLWEAATGKTLRRLDIESSVWVIAFSPDGRMLASGEFAPAAAPVAPLPVVAPRQPADEPVRVPVVRLREVATGKEIRRWVGHRNGISSLAFRPDGRALASGSWDTSILVWDVTRPEKGPGAAPLADKDLEELWEDLAGKDVPRAYRAVWRLASAPEQTVPFLAGRMRPVPSADARRLDRLVSELDSQQFAVREAASAELERLGEAAGPALYRALAGQTSLEVRTRVGRLLKKLEGEAESPERMRLARALTALEHCGDAAARRLLTQLAGGAAAAWQSREAKAALARLAVARP